MEQFRHRTSTRHSFVAKVSAALFLMLFTNIPHGLFAQSAGQSTEPYLPRTGYGRLDSLSPLDALSALQRAESARATACVPANLTSQTGIVACEAAKRIYDTVATSMGYEAPKACEKSFESLKEARSEFNKACANLGSAPKVCQEKAMTCQGVNYSEVSNSDEETLVNCPVPSEIKKDSKFKKCPEMFAGSLNKFYSDIRTITEDKKSNRDDLLEARKSALAAEAEASNTSNEQVKKQNNYQKETSKKRQELSELLQQQKKDKVEGLRGLQDKMQSIAEQRRTIADQIRRQDQEIATKIFEIDTRCYDRAQQIYDSTANLKPDGTRAKENAPGSGIAGGLNEALSNRRNYLKEATRQLKACLQSPRRMREVQLQIQNRINNQTQLNAALVSLLEQEQQINQLYQNQKDQMQSDLQTQYSKILSDLQDLQREQAQLQQQLASEAMQKSRALAYEAQRMQDANDDFTKSNQELAAAKSCVAKLKSIGAESQGSPQDISGANLISNVSGAVDAYGNALAQARLDCNCQLAGLKPGEDGFSPFTNASKKCDIIVKGDNSFKATQTKAERESNAQTAK